MASSARGLASRAAAPLRGAAVGEDVVAAEGHDHGKCREHANPESATLCGDQA
jgi:hypothetical protein